MKTLQPLRIFAMLCLAIVSLTSWANDDIISGSCGDNLTYRLDRYGTLTISGTGAMNNTRPWKDYSDVIKKLVIEEGVTSIAELAFYNCKIVNYVSIPESMTSIGSYAFEDCGQYKAYFCCLAKTMPTMGSSVFGSSSIFNRYEYSTLIVPESALNAYKSDSQWKVFGNIQAHNASGLIAGSCGDNVNYRLDYDGTLTISGTGAMTDYDIRTAPWYNNNSDISAIQVSDGVTYIGSYAFYGSNALSATLGADVASIGDRAFYNCQDLTSITCQATGVPTTGSELFRNVPQSNIVLYVPAASVEAYKAASWCSEFFRILPIGYPHVIAGHCGDYLSYELDSDGTLFIHGASSMSDYTSTTQPWKNQRGQIQTVELSAHTYSIGANAFSGCTGLTKVVCPSKSVLSVGTGAFDNVPLSSATLYVLSSMLDAYKASDKWNVFGTILPIESDTPTPDPTPIPAEPESVELTGESIVGQWNIVHVKTQKYLNGSLYKDDEETTAAPYDRIDFTLSTITYMEYSSSSNTWHQDMKGSYLLEGNKLVFNKDDYSWNDGSVIVYFVVSAYNGQNQMEITIRTDDENYDGSGSTRNTITTLTLERSTNPAFDSEPEGIELTGESIVGQWNIVSAKIKNYRDNVFTEEKSESFTAPYDRFDFTENTIMFMEHSSSSNGWHEDGKGTYRMEGNKLVYNKDGDFVFFVITAYDGQNSMEVVSRYDESKSGILYSEVATCVLERSTGGSNPEDDPGEEEDEETPEPSGIDINGINYTFYDSYAEVQYREGKYSGELTIPHTVYRDGRYYEVRSIGEKAFFGCDQLYKITIPDGVYEIKTAAFKGCTGLREVIIGTGLYRIQSRAFAGCTALKDFTIFNPSFDPDNQDNAYGYTEQFKDASVAEATLHVQLNYMSKFRQHNEWKQFGSILPVENDETTGFEINGINYSLYSENWTTYAQVRPFPASKNRKYSGDVNIPQYIYYNGTTYLVRKIGEKAFYGCEQLDKVVIPDGVNRIEESAFENCTKLREVIIGTGLYYLQSKAFAGCTALKDFTIFNPSFDPDNQDNAYGYTEQFKDASVAEATLHVQLNYMSKFRQHNEWKQFGSILPVENDETTGFEIDGINYSLYSEYWTTYAQVRPFPASKNKKYSNDVNIPQYIYYNGTTYLVRKIGEKAFYGCENLSKVVIPDGVDRIESSAFENCTNLKEVIVGTGLSNIQSRAFAGCTALTDFTIYSSGYYPNNMENTSDAFEGSALSQATLHVQPVYISEFRKHDVWSQFGNILPVENAENTGFEVNGINYALYGEYWTTYAQVRPFPASRNKKYQGDVTIPQYIYYNGNTYQVKRIGEKAFYGCENLSKVVIPDGVDRIESSAFENCTNLKEVIVGTGLSNIQSRAFAGCTALTDFTIYSSGYYPNNMENTSDAFEGSALSQATLHVQPVYISEFRKHDVWSQFGNILPVENAENTGFEVNGINYALYGEYWTTYAQVRPFPASRNKKYEGDVTIPQYIYYNGNTYQVKRIGEKAFYGCENLSKVVIPDGVDRIESSAFENCTNLKEVIVGTGLSNIQSRAFAGCTALTDFTIYSSGYYPNNMENTSDVFEGSALSQATLHVQPVYISEFRQHNVWSQFGTIQSIENPDDMIFANEGIYYAVYTVDGRKYAKVMSSPEGARYSGVINIPEKAYRNGITYEVRAIGDKAFYQCTGLTGVSIPATIREIGESAFEGCTSLSSFYSYATSRPTVNNKVFEGASISNATLYVPNDVVSLYAATDPWSGFGNILGLTDAGEPIYGQQCATPTIAYENGKLNFSCETPGAEFHSTITDADIQTRQGNEISLTKTYYISVYATAASYDKSAEATATLCWIDVEPQSGTTNVMETQALPVLITCKQGVLTIKGLNAGTHVTIYDVEGHQTNSGTSASTTLVLDSHIPAGSVAIVKIGNKSVKILIK